MARKSRGCAEAYISTPHKQARRLTQPGRKRTLSGQKKGAPITGRSLFFTTLGGRPYYIMPPIPPIPPIPPGMAGMDPSSFGLSAIKASVVSIRPAMDDAFCRA